MHPEKPTTRRLLEGYLLEPELCEELKITLRTARGWRKKGYGPPFLKLGRKVAYSIEATDAWMKSQFHL